VTNRGHQKSPEGLSGYAKLTSLKKFLPCVVEFLLSDMTIILELCPFDQFISNRKRAKPLTLDDVNVAGVLHSLRFAGENPVLLYPF
jgi:hypothetical protein